MYGCHGYSKVDTHLQQVEGEGCGGQCVVKVVIDSNRILHSVSVHLYGLKHHKQVAENEVYHGREGGRGGG